MTCPTCAIPNQCDDKYCRECGTRLPPPLVVPTAAGGEDPQVINLLSDAASALEAGEPEQAATAIQAALALQPTCAAAHSALAVVYERQGLIESAIEHVRRALEIDPDRVADERRLEELLARSANASRPAWIGSPKLAIAAAAVAATVVFGGGMLLLASGRQNGDPAEARASGITVAPSPAVTAAPAPGPRATPAAAPRAMPSVPIPLTSSRPGSPVVVPTPTAPRRATFAPAPVGEGGQRVGLPPVVSRSPIQGLPPAAIGEVVPLPPSAASGGVDQPQSPLQPPVGSGTAPSPTAAVPPTGQTPPLPVPTNSRPRVEPLETETGFIKIEVGGNRREETVPPATPPVPAPSVQTPGASRGAPTGISLQFGSGSLPATPQGNELEAARRAQRAGLDWLRKGQVAPAKQHLAQALRLYELAAQQSGPAQAEARQGAATCRRALGALQ